MSVGRSSPQSAIPSSSVPEHVHPRQAERQRRVHVEMRIDEGRAHQQPAGVDHRAGLGVDGRLDRGDAAVAHGDVLALATIGQRGVPYQ